MNKVPGCSTIDSDIISDRAQAFSRVYGKHVMDSRMDRQIDPLIEMHGQVYMRDHLTY